MSLRMLYKSTQITQIVLSYWIMVFQRPVATLRYLFTNTLTFFFLFNHCIFRTLKVAVHRILGFQLSKYGLQVRGCAKGMFIIYVMGEGAGKLELGCRKLQNPPSRNQNYYPLSRWKGGGMSNFGSIKMGGHVTFCSQVQVFPPPHQVNNEQYLMLDLTTLFVEKGHVQLLIKMPTILGSW